MNNDNPKEQEGIQIKLEEYAKLRDEYLAGWQRCKADFINFQKDEAERTAWLKKRLDRDWLLKILAFYDDLELAQNHLPDNLQDNEWIKANFMIYAKFLEELKKDGLEEIKALGEDFNPEFHEAIGETDSKEREPGTVAEVVQKGYLLNRELLRPAKVKIIK
ncbi:MAG: nucleotide exchange factor GrpE [Candidatus Pacebacteria bacterium]|nr:nucleotide exchange factor GrpE [Candidatus Paceibacterota bacterium]